jgi:hypothetical protein
MKIKVLKKRQDLNERYEIVSQFSSDYILNDVLDPNSKQSIFKKRLIFYDLETMGFLPQAYVHQIAALEYDLGDSFKKIFKGEELETRDLLAPEPTTGCIVKCAFLEERFKEGDDVVRQKRQTFADKFQASVSEEEVSKNYKLYKTSKESRKNYVYTPIVEAFQESIYGSTGRFISGDIDSTSSVDPGDDQSISADKAINMSMTGQDIATAIMGSVLATRKGADMFYKRLEMHLTNLGAANRSLTQNLKDLRSKTSHSRFKAMLRGHKQNDPDPESVRTFLSDLYDFVKAIVDNPYTFPSPKAKYMINLLKKTHNFDEEQKKWIERTDLKPGNRGYVRFSRLLNRYKRYKIYYYNLTELKKMTTNYARREFNLTWAENKSFTKYADFPLPEYYQFVRTADKKGEGYDKLPLNDFKTPEGDIKSRRMPSQKEGLEIFLKYLRDIGNEEYILVGHNIKSFDNNVILAKAEEEGIDSELILSFQDSYVFDTLPLMKTYVQQIKYMDKLVTEKINDALRAQGDDRTATSIEETKKQHDVLKERYPGLKSKLDGLMALHDSTKGLKQTHTADDDCKQLANVFIPTVLEMTKMLRDYNNLLRTLGNSHADDLETFDDRTFTQQPVTQSDLTGPVISKLKSDLLYDELDLIKKIVPSISITIDDLDFVPDDYAEDKNQYKSIKAYKEERKAQLDKLIRRFFYYINSELGIKGRVNNSSLRKVLNLNRSEVLNYFKKWIKELPNRQEDQKIVDKVIEFFEKEEELKTTSVTQRANNNIRKKHGTISNTENTPRLDESLINKWKKMIK